MFNVLLLGTLRFSFKHKCTHRNKTKHSVVYIQKTVYILTKARTVVRTYSNVTVCNMRLQINRGGVLTIFVSYFILTSLENLKLWLLHLDISVGFIVLMKIRFFIRLKKFVFQWKMKPFVPTDMRIIECSTE